MKDLKYPLVLFLFIFIVVIGLFFLHSLLQNLNSTASISPIQERQYFQNKKVSINSKEYNIPEGIVFTTFIRGELCTYILGSDPYLDPRCRYWRLNPDTNQLIELSPQDEYFGKVYDHQHRDTLLNDIRLNPNGCSTTLESEECSFGPSADNEDIYLKLKRGTDNKTRVLIYQLHDNQEEEVLPDYSKVPCRGRVLAWSHMVSEILFATSYEGTPKSPSGEQLKDLCVYNFVEKKIVYQKRLPVDTYGLSFADLRLGRIVLLGDNSDHLFIFYPTGIEQVFFSAKDKKVYHDQNASLLKQQFILIESSSRDFFTFQLYNLQSKNFLPKFTIPRVQVVDEHNPQGSDIINFEGFSRDFNYLVFRSWLVNAKNTPGLSNCWYSVLIRTGVVKKIICNDQLQALYPDKDPRDFSEFVHADYSGWY